MAAAAVVDIAVRVVAAAADIAVAGIEERVVEVDIVAAGIAVVDTHTPVDHKRVVGDRLDKGVVVAAHPRRLLPEGEPLRLAPDG